MTKDEGLFSLANIHRQYIACRRNKRGYGQRVALRGAAGTEPAGTARRAGCAQLRTKPFCLFFVERPKLREIFAADFRDRVVHHVLVSYLEKTWERVFIHDSYACR